LNAALKKTRTEGIVTLNQDLKLNWARQVAEYLLIAIGASERPQSDLLG
jgi:hypothetical protein